MDKAEIERRVKKAADMLELGPLLDRKPKQLSGGQRQRVAMGRAIVREPQVFLMDEPLSNLDAKLRVQMRAEIAQVQRDLNVTTIYVTHDQIEAMTMGDRVALMKAGVLQQLGSPQHLYDHPDNIFVAGFIGSPPMNMAIARVEQATATACSSGSAARPCVLPASVARRAPGARVVRRARRRGRHPQRGHGGRRRSPAATVAADARIRATVEPDRGARARRSWSTSTVDAPRVVTEDTKALEKDAGTDDVPVAHHGQHLRRVVQPAVAGAARRRGRDRGRRRAAALLRPGDRPGDPRLRRAGGRDRDGACSRRARGSARAATRHVRCGTPSGRGTR